jgi:uncharacterized membrane protein HdeD (DUF308 family)
VLKRVNAKGKHDVHHAPNHREGSHPGDEQDRAAPVVAGRLTFLALAAVMSFVLIFAGTFDIITAISARKEIEVWWLQLVGGIIELLLGF